MQQRDQRTACSMEVDMSGGFVTCSECGQVVVSNYRFCAVCGNDLLAPFGSRPIENQPVQPSQPVQSRAAQGQKMPPASSNQAIGPGVRKKGAIVPAGSMVLGPGALQAQQPQQVSIPRLCKDEYEVYEEEKESVADKIVDGIDTGINIGARIYGGVLVVVGIVATVALANPVMLLVSAYGVYLVLGGSWIIF